MAISEMAGAALAQGAINNLNDALKQERQARHYKENAAYDYKLQMDAQRENFPNAVLSLKEAGLNPALATGSSAMSTGASSTPTGSDTSVAPLDPKIGLMDKEKDVLSSQIALNASGEYKNNQEGFKAGEEGRRLKQVNDEFDRKLEWFDWLSDSYLADLEAQYNSRGDKDRADVVNALRDLKAESFETDNPLYFTPALAEAFTAIGDAQASQMASFSKEIQEGLAAAVANGQLQNTRTLNALIKAPATQSSYIFKQMSEIGKRMELMDTQKEINEADVDRIEAEIVNLGKEYEKMDADIQKAFSSDVKRYSDHKDYLGAGLKMLGECGLSLGMLYLLKNPVAAGAATAGAKQVIAKGAEKVKGVVSSPKLGSALEKPSALTGEAQKAIDYQQRVGVPFKQRTEQNKAWGDFRRFYKGYKKEHNHQ